MSNKRLIVFHNSTDDKDATEPMTHRERKAFNNRNYRVTVVGLLQPDNVIVGGVAVCSPKDNFSRVKGTTKATHRLANKPVIIGSLLETNNKSEKELINAATKVIKKYSERVRNIAKKRHSSLRAIIFKGA